MWPLIGIQGLSRFSWDPDGLLSPFTLHLLSTAVAEPSVSELHSPGLFSIPAFPFCLSGEGERPGGGQAERPGLPLQSGKSHYLWEALPAGERWRGAGPSPRTHPAQTGPLACCRGQAGSGALPAALSRSVHLLRLSPRCRAEGTRDAFSPKNGCPSLSAFVSDTDLQTARQNGAEAGGCGDPLPRGFQAVHHHQPVQPPLQPRGFHKTHPHQLHHLTQVRAHPSSCSHCSASFYLPSPRGFCCSGLEDQLLGQVVAEERPDLEEARNQLILSNAEMRQELEEIEDQILYRLSTSEGNPVDDLELIKVLEASKLKAGEIQV